MRDQFGDIRHQVTSEGIPVIDGAPASFVCRVASVHPAGDHPLFLGLVEYVVFKPGKAPLVFFTGGCRAIGG